MPDDAVNFQAPLQLRYSLTLASPTFSLVGSNHLTVFLAAGRASLP
jgi:hypothetical protein